MPIKALMREYRPKSAPITAAATKPKHDPAVDDTAEVQRTAARAGKDDKPIGAKQVLALQQTRGNQAVRRLLADKALPGNPNMVQAHNTGRKHKHKKGANSAPPSNAPQSGPSGLTKLGLNTAPVLDLLANSVAPIGEMSETVKPYSDMLGALSGSVTGTTDQVDPTKDDKVEKGLSGMGGLVGMSQLATKGVEMTSKSYGKGAEGLGKQLGGKVVPGMDLVSGGYKAGKSGMDYSSFSGLLTRTQQIASSASGYPQVKNAADLLIKILNNKIYLAKWDIGTGIASSVGGMTGLVDSYLGEGVMSDYVKVPGTVLGLGGKLLGSDTLWQGLQYLTGERVWSTERYNQENDKMDDQLVQQVDLLVDPKNSSINHLSRLYNISKVVAPKFADALKNKATSLGRINQKNAKKFK